MAKSTRSVKRQRILDAEEEFEILVAFDFVVEKFSPIHYRVNDCLDVWPSTQRYYDRERGLKGKYTGLRLSSFVRGHFGDYGLL